MDIKLAYKTLIENVLNDKYIQADKICKKQMMVEFKKHVQLNMKKYLGDMYDDSEYDMSTGEDTTIDSTYEDYYDGPNTYKPDKSCDCKKGESCPICAGKWDNPDNEYKSESTKIEISKFDVLNSEACGTKKDKSDKEDDENEDESEDMNESVVKPTPTKKLDTDKLDRSNIDKKEDEVDVTKKKNESCTCPECNTNLLDEFKSLNYGKNNITMYECASCGHSMNVKKHYKSYIIG